MSAEFSMKCKWDNSNLYIKAAGDFTKGAAESLSAVLLTQQNRVCRIFVDTVKLDVDEAAATQHFRQTLVQGAMGKELGGQIFFKGKQGFALAVDGCRVLLTKKKACQCKTPCARCLCAERSQQRREGEKGQAHSHAEGHCHCHHGEHDDRHGHGHGHAHEQGHKHSHGHEQGHKHKHSHAHEHAHGHAHEHSQHTQDFAPQSARVAHG